MPQTVRRRRRLPRHWRHQPQQIAGCHLTTLRPGARTAAPAPTLSVDTAVLARMASAAATARLAGTCHRHRRHGKCFPDPSSAGMFYCSAHNPLLLCLARTPPPPAPPPYIPATDPGGGYLPGSDQRARDGVVVGLSVTQLGQSKSGYSTYQVSVEFDPVTAAQSEPHHSLIRVPWPTGVLSDQLLIVMVSTSGFGGGCVRAIWASWGYSCHPAGVPGAYDEVARQGKANACVVHLLQTKPGRGVPGGCTFRRGHRSGQPRIISDGKDTCCLLAANDCCMMHLLSLLLALCCLLLAACCLHFATCYLLLAACCLLRVINASDRQ